MAVFIFILLIICISFYLLLYWGVIKRLSNAKKGKRRGAVVHFKTTLVIKEQFRPAIRGYREVWLYGDRLIEQITYEERPELNNRFEVPLKDILTVKVFGDYLSISYRKGNGQSYKNIKEPYQDLNRELERLLTDLYIVSNPTVFEKIRPKLAYLFSFKRTYFGFLFVILLFNWFMTVYSLADDFDMLWEAEKTAESILGTNDLQLVDKDLMLGAKGYLGFWDSYKVIYHFDSDEGQCMVTVTNDRSFDEDGFISSMGYKIN